MNDKQKRYALYGGAGLILLYLLYRWYSGNQASNAANTGAGVTAPDTSGSDFASLAGQEQGDVATLQRQEASDISGLQTALTGLTGQESADVSGLTGSIGGLSSQLEGLSTLQSSLGDQVAAIAMGVQPVSPATVSTHKGGPFYNYFVKVTGHAPPPTVQASNFIYQAWKSGVKATALQAPKPHPSAPKQTQVAHPNGTHTAQTQVAHPNTVAAKSAPAPKPKAAAPAKPAPKPKPAPAKTKAKASGPRK